MIPDLNVATFRQKLKLKLKKIEVKTFLSQSKKASVDTFKRNFFFSPRKKLLTEILLSQKLDISFFPASASSAFLCLI